MDPTMEITLQDIYQAHERIKKVITRTPIIDSTCLQTSTIASVELKLESMQITGSFKLRGATHKILSLSDEEKARGVTMERGPAMYLSLKAGRLVPVEAEGTLADALMGGLGDENHYTFRICHQYVDDIVLVSEDAIARAMAYAFNEHRMVVEGGGAMNCTPTKKAPD